ncbi:hypothetical protein BU17DRAFT_89732 [Hysterangium stoloniferum]|nr:hypothetical protein BU17DRAFT_89732 [Hysterangium stoloniferum]
MGDTMTMAKEYWERCNFPANRAKPFGDDEEMNEVYGQLRAHKGVVQIYIAMAIAQMYHKLDLLYHLEMDSQWIRGELEDAEVEGFNVDLATPNPGNGFVPRPFHALDELVHRVYKPLQCAVDLCQDIKSKNLLGRAAEHLAGHLPSFATGSMLLMCIQHLEICIDPNQNLGLDFRVMLAENSLNMIKGDNGINGILRDLWENSTFVLSYRHGSESSIPSHIIQHDASPPPDMTYTAYRFLGRRHLPNEIYYYILLHLFVEHLHSTLVDGEVRPWNPFEVLPLVSRHFHEVCWSLYHGIFGLSQEVQEGQAEQEERTIRQMKASSIKEILEMAVGCWEMSDQHPPTAPDPQEFEDMHKFLEQWGNGLINIYIYAAVAKSFYNSNVASQIEMDKRWTQGMFNDVRPDESNLVYPYNGDFTLRPFQAADECVYRHFNPLDYALALCDLVRPREIVYRIADYLAGNIPAYTTAPVFLVHTHHLEYYLTNLTHEEKYFKWSLQNALQHISDIDTILTAYANMSKLVKGRFQTELSIPADVIKDTRILEVLRQLVRSDLGGDTESTDQIQGLANNLWLKLTKQVEIKYGGH